MVKVKVKVKVKRNQPPLSFRTCLSLNLNLGGVVPGSQFLVRGTSDF